MPAEGGDEGHPNISSELNAEINAREGLPRMSRSLLKVGDIMLLDCLGSDGSATSMSWKVEEIKKEEPDWTDVVVTVIGNTSKSPVKIGERYVLLNSAMTKRGTMVRADDDLQKSSYQLLAPEKSQVKGLDTVRTSFIKDITLMRKDEVIKPFEQGRKP